MLAAAAGCAAPAEGMAAPRGRKRSPPRPPPTPKPLQETLPEPEAPPEPPPPSFPRLGAHVGLVLPLVRAGNPGGVLGRDFVSLGVAPGLVVELDERWALDFELVLYADLQGTGSPGTLVVAPGGTYDFGFLRAGLRAAVAAGGSLDTQWGFEPFVRKAFALGPVTPFVGLDLPLFFRVGGATWFVQPRVGFVF